MALEKCLSGGYILKDKYGESIAFVPYANEMSLQPDSTNEVDQKALEATQWAVNLPYQELIANLKTLVKELEKDVNEEGMYEFKRK